MNFRDAKCRYGFGGPHDIARDDGSSTRIRAPARAFRLRYLYCSGAQCSMTMTTATISAQSRFYARRLRNGRKESRDGDVLANGSEPHLSLSRIWRFEINRI